MYIEIFMERYLKVTGITPSLVKSCPGTSGLFGFGSYKHTMSPMKVLTEKIQAFK